MDKRLLVIGGATATGKTALAIRLAQQFGTEILSADSRQLYREMSIGTAKPTEEELAAAPHHFIDHVSIEEPYSVGDYEREALALLEKLFQNHQVVILCGGSGLYLKSVCEGLDLFPEVPLEVRQKVEAWYAAEGIGPLQEELRKVDSEYYEEVDLQNPHRLIRALALHRASGQRMSDLRRGQAKARFFQPHYYQLTMERDELYQRINRRVDRMLEAGLVEEARALYPRKHLPALQTVGYQELFDYFDGKHDLEEAVRLIKRNSRRYAKRQLTWFRRDGFWERELGTLIRELSRDEG